MPRPRLKRDSDLSPWGSDENSPNGGSPLSSQSPQSPDEAGGERDSKVVLDLNHGDLIQPRRGQATLK